MSPELSDRLGLPLWAIAALAALAVPRIVVHDLIGTDSIAYVVLTWAPPVVWIAAVLVRHVPNPFLTCLAIGVAYGVLLAVTHQVLWHWSFDEAPRLGDRLEDVLPRWLEAIVIRLFAAVSSVMTGVVVGAVAGAISHVLHMLRGNARRPQR